MTFSSPPFQKKALSVKTDGAFFLYIKDFNTLKNYHLFLLYDIEIVIRYFNIVCI